MDCPSMVDATRDGDRLEQLKTLALVIAAQIDDGDPIAAIIAIRSDR